MNNLLRHELVAAITAYTEDLISSVDQITFTIQQPKQLIQQNFAAKQQCNYFFKSRSKL